jgi:hypothetical protein
MNNRTIIQVTVLVAGAFGLGSLGGRWARPAPPTG